MMSDKRTEFKKVLVFLSTQIQNEGCYEANDE